MSTWIFVIGGFILYFAVQARIIRVEERRAELKSFEQEVRAAKFWRYDAESAEKEYKEKVREQGHWKNNIKFKLINWTAIAIGLVLCFIAGAFWLEEDPTRTAGQLWNLAGETAAFAIIGGMFVYWVYQVIKRLDRAENEIAWLNQTTKALADNYQRWAENVAQRLEVLEENSS